MRKMFALILIIVLIFSSCSNDYNSSKKDNEVVLYGDNMEYLTYNDNDYMLFDTIKYFSPFLSDSSDNREEYLIEEDYIADERDENVCFIYNDGGILGNLSYKRIDIDIPQIISEPEKVDSIIISTSNNDYYINNYSDISLLIEFFSSEPIVSLSKESYTNTIPTENISFYAISTYYGGEFSLERGLVVIWGDVKIIKNNEQEIPLPNNIIDVISRAIGCKTGDGSMSYSG